MRELLDLADALNEENPGQPELERQDKTVGDLMREAEERAERMKKESRSAPPFNQIEVQPKNKIL